MVRYTKKFDNVELQNVEVSKQQIQDLAAKIPTDQKNAINTAYKNIKAFHEAQKLDANKELVETMPGVVCWRESRPIEKVGLYIPGGSAPLVSTMLMLGIPAQIAGCNQIITCTPPQPDSTVTPAICYAASLVGVTQLFCIGGAQAIAAMSIGTKSIPKVDKIFGPGNQYVTASKMYAQKFGVAIDMPAGPSEILVIADNNANSAYVAADLLSQAEHGSDSQVALATTDQVLAEAVRKEVGRQTALLPRKEIIKRALDWSYCVVFVTVDDAIDFANTYAPEHLILQVASPSSYVSKVKSAGSVFLGKYTPESAGDYASGTNHSLPTDGWARSYGGVSLDSFVKKITFQSISKTGLQNLAPTILTLAKTEGLDAHAQSVSIRVGPN